MKAESPDWKALISPDNNVIGDPRSCKNCLHMQNSSDTELPIFWKCLRTMNYCEAELRWGKACGVELKLWTPQPQQPPGIWHRIIKRIVG